jgi:hypothetical protein
MPPTHDTPIDARTTFSTEFAAWTNASPQSHRNLDVVSMLVIVSAAGILQYERHRRSQNGLVHGTLD